MPEEHPTLSVRDHDLLIRLDQKVDSLTVAIQRIEDNTVSRLSALENDHVTRKEFDDHEARLRQIDERRLPNIEKKMAYYAGAIAVLVVVGELVVKFFHP